MFEENFSVEEDDLMSLSYHMSQLEQESIYKDSCDYQKEKFRETVYKALEDYITEITKIRNTIGLKTNLQFIRDMYPEIFQMSVGSCRNYFKIQGI